MTFYETMRTISGKDLSKEQAKEFAVDQWGLVCAFIEERYEQVINYPEQEHCDMLASENKNLAKALEREGYTQDEISDVANGAI